MQRPRWFWLFAAVISVTLFTFAACGDDDKDEPSGEDTPTTGATTTPGDDEYAFVLTDAPDDAAAPEDQKLRVNLRGEPDTIDPQKASFADSISVTHMLFAGLLTFDDDVNVVPLLAKEVPSLANGGISSDGLTYTFKLRTDAKWSDGQPVTANDFEYAMKRLFDPNVGGYYASVFTDIVGAADAYAATEATPAEVQALLDQVGVEATDDSTLVVTLTQSVPTFVQRMVLHSTLPIRQDVVAAHPDDWTEPENIVTNGPFALTEWVHEDHLTMKANPDFFLGEPILQEITMVMQPDTNVTYAQYQADELETAQVPPAAREEVRNTLADELQQGSQLSTFGVQINNGAAPFDDVNVRKALNAAMDRDAYIVGVLQGVGLPATSWIPPGIPGSDTERGIGFDAAAAKQFLADSEKYPNGEGMPAIKFMLADDTQNLLIGEYVKAQARDVLGIDIELEVLESAAYEERHSNEEFQLALAGWGADYPDPDNWLPAQFGTDASLNQYNYSNPEVDALFDQAAVELDNDKRIALYEQAETIIIEQDSGIIPLSYTATFHLKKPRVKGWRQHPLDAQIPGDYGYARVYISN